jgi:type II secretory pathway predicted ATPase ExeA
MLPIYCGHFGLTREPFNITPDPNFLYMSVSHREALAQLVYGIKARRGFVVLTGEVGTGKTTMIQCLLDELNSTTKTALIFNMVVSPKDLLRYVCEKFGLVAQHESLKEIHDYVSLLERFLLESYRKGENVALIIDEAQNLSTEVLENVRLLSNFETAQDKLLQILLVGQPELGVRLNATELRQIKQRVALRHHLTPLSYGDCEKYIAKRLEIAGGSITLFGPKAIDAVHKYSGGIPRLVNIICDNALLTVYALRKDKVEAGMIAEVAQDLQLTVSPVFATVPVDLNVERAISLNLKNRGSAPADLTALKPERNVTAADSTSKTQPDSVPIVSNVDRSTATVVYSRDAKSNISTASKFGSGVVTAQFLDYMISALTEAMGPMASVIVYEQIGAMGESFTEFPKRRVVELIENTTREISSESAKANCKRAMLEAMRGIAHGH